MKTIMTKIKEKKDLIIKFSAMILFVVLISLVTLGILMMTGVLTYDKGFNFNTHIFDAFTGKWYAFIMFILVQTILSMLLCAIPGVAMGLIIVIKMIYSNAPWTAFFVSFSSVLLASTVLYAIGRFGGYKLCEKLIGKEDCENSLSLLRNRGTIYFPIMMLFPIFPDDALVMLAGVTKMKLSWFIPSIVLCRGIGILTIIFSFDIIPFDRFEGVYDWLILITVAFFWIREIFKLANKLDKKFDERRKSKLENTEENSNDEKVSEEV